MLKTCFSDGDSDRADSCNKEQGFPTMPELIHSDDEDGELSVFICKAITQEI